MGHLLEHVELLRNTRKLAREIVWRKIIELSSSTHLLRAHTHTFRLAILMRAGRMHNDEMINNQWAEPDLERRRIIGHVIVTLGDQDRFNKLVHFRVAINLGSD